MNVYIHSTQYPARVRQALADSLRRRELNHKFLYESNRQAQKWLALHEACSPARTDPDCEAVYQKAFARAAQLTGASRLHVVGLGCGGGQKDAQLLGELARSGCATQYTALDVSLALVLASAAAAQAVSPAIQIFPIVADLAEATDLGGVLAGLPDAGEPRLLTFFGMLPNFEPGVILPRLGEVSRRGDWLLFSANLAPGPDYREGVRRILPLYDNALTRDWLLAFWWDLGVDPRDGMLKFEIEECPTGTGLARIVAWFEFVRTCEIRVDSETFTFSAGDRMRLFFSYRHTPDKARNLFTTHGWEMVGHWVTRSEEEGVFLARR